MREVEEALDRLEGVIFGLDPSRREAVTKLVSSLQTCLRLPPGTRRQTIGVSAGELAAARKWFEPPPEEMCLERVTYKPVAQRPGYFVEPAPQNGILSYIAKAERSLSGDSGSLHDYDPSLILFTPEQTVQIAVHKAAINKQISQEEKRRESSDDGDVSSGDDENMEVNNYNEVSSAQRLLQLAAENAKKNPSAARFHNRSSRKLKMKRANTIDIPKPANFYEYSSGDEYGASADEVNSSFENGRRVNKEKAFLPPTFEPKTENDLKFLAFLKQVNDNQPKVQTYNPSARGGKHWQKRFSSIKTAFENVEHKPPSAAPSPAKMFWQNTEAGRSKSSRDQPSKLPWTVKTENDGVIIGSLTVTKPGHVNNFNHAPKSAFKPIEKKPVSTVSGTVKQIAAQKFSVGDNEFINKPIEKPTAKKVPSVLNSSPNLKQMNSSSAFKPFSATNNALHRNKATENLHPSNSNTSSNANNYISSKQFKSSQPPVSDDYSQMTNGSHETKYKYNSPVSQTKPKPSSTVPNYNSLSSNFEPYKHNNNKYDYVSKAQQNTMVAKKQFMDSTPVKPNKEEDSSYCFDQTVKVPRKETRATNSYQITDFKPTYSNSNGLSKSSDNYRSNYDYQPQLSQTLNNYNYPLSTKPVNDNTYSTSNVIQPKPGVHRGGHSFSQNSHYDNYGSQNSLHPTYIESNGNNNAPKYSADIIEPLIIPKESIQNRDRKPISNYNSKFVDVPFVPQEKRASDFIASHTHSSSVIDSRSMSSDFHDSSSYFKESFEPSPPLRRDSLPKNAIHNDRVYSENIKSPSPVHRLDILKSSRNDSTFCDNQNSFYSSPANQENNYMTSPSHENKPYTAYISSSNNTLNSSNASKTPTEISKSNYLVPTIVPTPPLTKDNPPSPSSNVPTPSSVERISPTKYYNNVSKPHLDPRYLSPAYHSVSPSQRYEDDDSPWGSIVNGDDESPHEEKAVSRVMGQAQCQQAVTVNNRTRRRFDIDLESELKLQLKQSAQKKSLSPSFPNVIQKSESWHQMVKEQMQQAKQAPPLPKISKAKSSHALAQPKQFEAALAPDSVTQKKITVSQYLAKQQGRSVKSTKSNPKYKSTNTLYIEHDDDLDNVDEVFETIFQETTKKRNSK